MRLVWESVHWTLVSVLPPGSVAAERPPWITHAASEAEGMRLARVPSLVKPSGLQGIENENVTPGPLFGVAHSRP